MNQRRTIINYQLIVAIQQAWKWISKRILFKSRAITISDSQRSEKKERVESIKSSTELARHTITLSEVANWRPLGGDRRKFAFLAHVEASTRGADSIRARAESQIREGMSPAAHLNSIRSAWRALARGRAFFSAVSARKNWTVLSDNRRGKSRWIRREEGSGETSTRARRPGEGLSRSTGAGDSRGGRWKSYPFDFRGWEFVEMNLWSVISSFTNP